MAAKVAFLVLIVCCYVDCETLQCTKAGYFADTSDETCKHYTLCVYDSTNAKYNNYYYTCSGTSIFNPNTLKCTDPSGYQCKNSVTTKSTTTTTTTTTIKPTTSEPTTVTESTVEYTTTEKNVKDDCTKEGSIPDSSDTTCKAYTMCIYNKDTDKYDAYSYTCQGTSVFNPNTAKCTATTNYACGDTTTNEPTTTELTTTQGNVFECTKEGNFPDPSDNTCKQYETCVYDSASSGYKAYDYTCPGSSVFNPNTAKCTSSINYVCGSPTTTNSPETTTVVDTTTTTVTTAATPDTTTTELTTTQATIFKCTQEGSFPDPTDTTCTKYKVCIINNDTSEYDSYDSTCPGSTVFNPNTSQCTTTSNYKCVSK